MKASKHPARWYGRIENAGPHVGFAVKLAVSARRREIM